MILRFVFIQISIVCIIAGGSIFGQAPGTGDKVDVFLNVAQLVGSKCEKLELGRPVRTLAPEYPEKAKEARIGGAVRVEILVGVDGRVLRVLNASGPRLLVSEAKKAALENRFSGSKCDGIPVVVRGLLVFNFVPTSIADLYTYPTTKQGFADITEDSPFYEPVRSLTENYGLTFGYADGAFHPDDPLTKGDFLHFLRLTLDLLQKKAEAAKKFPLEIGLFSAVNPQNLTSSDALVDLDTNKPYAESVGFLISKYDIALVNNKMNLNGDLPLTLNEVVDYWERVFGTEALPVNFRPLNNGSRVMSRGEFALFLQESLYVLTYKVLP